MKTYVIDATNKTLGRVASEAAKHLRGKGYASFENHKLADVAVTIKNASKITIDPRKMLDKEYLEYSGYPGGQKKYSLQQLVDRRGYKGIFEKAVYGMLPDNRLAKEMMKHLIIEE